MKRLSFIKLIIVTCVCIAAAEFHSSAAPLITAVDPETGSVGTELDIFGTEFTGLNRILFTERSSGAHADSPFSLLSDTHVLTTVPSRVGSRWLISLFSPLGATVTIPSGYFDITSTAVGSPSAVYLVHDGGVLTAGGGSSTIFVESGGSCVGAGGGNLTVYVQRGGTYMHGNGGGSLVFYEPGATIVGGGGIGNIFTEVTAIQPSFVPVPEPSVVVIFVAGVVLAALMKRRSVRDQRPSRL